MSLMHTGLGGGWSMRYITNWGTPAPATLGYLDNDNGLRVLA